MTFGPPEDPEFQVGPSDDDPEPEEDFLAEAEPERHTALPPRVEAWRKRSATGAILTGFALGLQEALETKRQDPSIVVQTSGDPPRDLPVEADFEYGRPRQTIVNIRPWLLESTAGSTADGGDPPPGDAEAGSGEP